MLYVNVCIGVMRTTSCSELRKTLASALDRVVEDREPVIITWGRGKPAVVLMSLEEFASWESTLHLLQSPANAARLKESVDQFDQGRRHGAQAR
jgi:antitoxin YefM